jgi:hypothetical protein
MVRTRQRIENENSFQSAAFSPQSAVYSRRSAVFSQRSSVGSLQSAVFSLQLAESNSSFYIPDSAFWILISRNNIIHLLQCKPDYLNTYAFYTTQTATADINCFHFNPCFHSILVSKRRESNY